MVVCAAALLTAGPAAATTPCESIGQQAVPGYLGGQLRVTVVISKNATITQCTDTSSLKGSAPAATNIASLSPSGKCSVTATGVKHTGDGFTCSNLPDGAVVTVVYVGAPGADATSRATLTNSGTSASSSVASAFDPALLRMSHVVGSTAGTATDKLSLVNKGSVSLDNVKQSATVSSSWPLSSVKVASNLPLSCGTKLVNSDTITKVCKLTNPLAAGAIWTLLLKVTGTAGYSEKDSAVTTFSFTPGTKQLAGQDRGSTSGALAGG